MKTKKIQVKELRMPRDNMYSLMNDPTLSQGEKNTIREAALVICNLIDLKKIN